jgi:hypothetical protein
MSILNKALVLGSALWSLVEGSYIVSDLYKRDVAIKLCAVGDVSGMEKIKKERNVSCSGTCKGSNKLRFLSLKY